MTLGKLAEYMQTFKAIFEVKRTIWQDFFAYLWSIIIKGNFVT